MRYFLPYAMNETKTPSGLLKMDPNTIQIHRKILSKSYCIRDYSQGQHYVVAMTEACTVTTSVYATMKHHSFGDMIKYFTCSKCIHK